MPQKAKVVRFANKNLFHSPPTPALSVGLSDISSAGPVTPPSATSGLPGPTPYGPQYFPKSLPPPVNCGLVRPHRYLEASGILWDLTEHPSLASRHREPISRRVLAEPATSPPLFFISIRSRYLPWVILVKATVTNFVSVGDVLDAIYRSLRTNIVAEEFNSLPTSNDQRRATRAYEKRYRKLQDPRDYDAEKRGGVKRIDFLMERSRFDGISNSGTRPEEWILHTRSS